MLHPFPMEPVHVVAGCFSSPTGEVLVAQRAIGEAEGGRWEFRGESVSHSNPGPQRLSVKLRRNPTKDSLDQSPVVVSPTRRCGLCDSFDSRSF